MENDHGQDALAKPALRERKKMATRDALAAAAVKLALQYGLEQLRVEDIANEANVSMRTFNNYFGSKHEALVARYMDRMRHAADALASRPEHEPLWEAIIAALLLPWKDTLRGHKSPEKADISELRVIYGAPAVQSEILKAALADDHPFTLAVATRTQTDPARELFPKLVTACVTAATQVAINSFLSSDPSIPLVPLMRSSIEQLAAGLPPPVVRK